MPLAYLDGVPLPIALLDERVARLREGPRAAALPVPGSAEDRQLRRWVAQVIVTERLCEASFGGGTSLARLDPVAAVELGSINAAAYEGSAAVRAAFEHVAASTAADHAQAEAYLAATAHRPEPPTWDDAVAHVRDAAARRAFVIWLDGERERRVRLVAGLEHPGDPGQPDNHHRH
ncbi:malonyl CoA-ACP transacylase [Actinorhabdospora filicis]|uniref:Malonyl CoA-ACP transacylase n=1 Tax=Actinorhabdospora filicis TaxID=1785913 RepID=A0A9W6SJS3_9ACTN|nr:hypothetical protein [Actinorhabdospora filicis]GLZ76936.1 malonyl CoA-ACP transacylase [Actinorhabdospora filicis]